MYFALIFENNRHMTSYQCSRLTLARYPGASNFSSGPVCNPEMVYQP